MKLLSHGQLSIYVDTAHWKVAPLSNCFGFIDGTVRSISRPNSNQRIFNGHKRIHGSLALPNGLIVGHIKIDVIIVLSTTESTMHKQTLPGVLISSFSLFSLFQSVFSRRKVM